MNRIASIATSSCHLCKQLFILSAPALLIAAGCGEREAARLEAVSRPRVKVVRLERRRFADKAPVQGTIRAKSSAMVSARVPGAIGALLVEEGAHVKEGTPLFRVDRENLVNAVRSAENDIALAEAALAQSEASLEKAEVDRERVLRVVKTGGVSQSDADKAVLSAKTASAQLAWAKALLSKSRTGLAVAKKNLADSEVRAPFSGIVTRKLKDAGDYVAPGTPVFAMEGDGPCEVRFSLDAARYAAVKVGETEVGGEKVFWKSPTVDAATRTFEVRTRTARSETARPGMLVTAEAVFAAVGAPAVPASAVNPMPDGKSAVFIVENGKVVRRNVSVRAESDGWCAIGEGDLDPAAKIVADGMLLLHEGDEVAVVEDGK